MEIRPGTPDDASFTDAETSESLTTNEPVTSMTWRVDRTMTVAKAIGALAFAGLPQVFGTNLASRWFGLLVAVVLVVYAARDLVAPSRLAADAEGLTVIRGYAGHRRVAWSDIERVRVDARRRAGFLEIETADSLHLFSRYDLSMPPDQALVTLDRIRPASARPAPPTGGADASG